MLRFSNFKSASALSLIPIFLAAVGCSRSEVSTAYYEDGGAPIALFEEGSETDDSGETETGPDTSSEPGRPMPPGMPAPAPDNTTPPGSPGAPQTCDVGMAGVCAGLGPGASRCDGNRLVVCDVDAEGCAYQVSAELSADCAALTGAEADCSDGLDDDGDGAVDCDDDDCRALPVCTPEDCGNGVDDDADGDVDCDDDECTASQCMMTCGVDIDLGSALGAVWAGTTVGAGNDITAECADGSEGSDVIFSWRAGEQRCVVIDTFGSEYDTSLHVHGPCPGFEEYACDDDSGNDVQSQITLLTDPGEPLLIVVDGFGVGTEGQSVLNINECVELCTDFDDNDLDGLFDCDDPDCAGDTACVPEVCDNGMDDDGDGAVDCADGECASTPACVEDCTDGLDNNQDGLLDCADPSCAQTSACLCEAAITIGSSATGLVASGSTVGAERTASATCGADADSPDMLFSWTPPATGCYELDTFGSAFDTALHVHSDCPAFDELNCNDDAIDVTGAPVSPDNDLQSRVRLVFEQGVPYIIVVDGYGDDSSGSYRLNLNPCVEVCDNSDDDDLDNRADCADPDCASASECIDEICDNGVDDDGDGALDCLDTECVLEPICDEVCDDLVDNDGDMLVDCYDPECSADPDCFVCVSADADIAGSVGTPVLSGSTDGTGADVTASCGGDARSEDLVVAWTAPTSDCYQFDTVGSDYDSVLHIHAECPGFEQLACDDDSGVNLTSRVELDVTADTTYFIVVDGFGENNSGDFALNIELCP